MSAATRRAARDRAAAAQALIDAQRSIAYHASCETQHLAAARDATDEHTRLSHQAHADYHRSQADALARKLKEVK